MLHNKKILLISPQPWGQMFVAKHHYAVELARLGNEVYFLNPPSYNGWHSVHVENNVSIAGLRIIDHTTVFPTIIRFKLRKLYDGLMKRHVRWLMKKLDVGFDIVWCFDANLYSDLQWFSAKKKIFHPVDELFYSYQLNPGMHADLVVSVTKEILSRFSGKKLFVNHGISREFVAGMNGILETPKSVVTVGYSGNLLRKDIDFETLRKCITALPGVRFVFWGNYRPKQSNLEEGTSTEANSFIDFLQHSPNVELRGQFPVSELVKEYKSADLFLVCYDILKDQSRGTNYHKVMEFLSTGKVIVSNNVSTYQGLDLFRMCNSRTSNDEYVELLKDTIANLPVYNSPENQEKRKQYALQNTYQQHIEQICSFLHDS